MEQDVRSKIVVGVDGSPASCCALQWAVEHARLTGASLKVIACWEFPITYGWEVPARPLGVRLANRAKRTLEAAVASVLGDDPDVEIELAVVDGHPAHVLLDAARDASLLVVGSRGHGAFTGMLLGSVSRRCVHHAPCPVIVVRDRGHRTKQTTS